MAFDMFAGGKSTTENQSTYVDSFGVQTSSVFAPTYSNVGNVTITTANGSKLPTGNAALDTLGNIVPVVGVLLIVGAFLLTKK